MKLILPVLAVLISTASSQTNGGQSCVDSFNAAVDTNACQALLEFKQCLENLQEEPLSSVLVAFQNAKVVLSTCQLDNDSDTPTIGVSGLDLIMTVPTGGTLRLLQAPNSIDILDAAQKAQINDPIVATLRTEVDQLKADLAQATTMLNMLVAGDLIKRMSIAEQSIDGLAIRTQKLEDLDNSDVVSRLVEALHAGDGTGSTDEQIQNLLDLSQIQRNTDAIQLLATKEQLNTKASQADLDNLVQVVNDKPDNTRTDAEIEAVIDELAGGDFSEIVSSVYTHEPTTLKLFRFVEGNFRSKTGTNFLDMTASRMGREAESVAGSFYLNEKRKLKYTFHIGGDWVDGANRKVAYRLVCSSPGKASVFLPDAGGHTIFKYITNNRLDSESFDHVTEEMEAGQWTCKLQVNPGSTSPYNWDSAYGEIIMLVGEVEAFNPELPEFKAAVPQQVFRVTTGNSRGHKTPGFKVFPGFSGEFKQFQSGAPVPYHLSFGGDWVDTCGHPVKYRVQCLNYHTSKVVYLPDENGHKIYKYVDYSRLESETFSGVTTELDRGVWNCNLQIDPTSTCDSYNWDSTYGEGTLVMGAQGDARLQPQQVYRVTSGTYNNDGSNQFRSMPASGTYVQAVSNAPVHYTMHTGGDWVDGADRRMYYRLTCTSGGATVLLPDARGHLIFKYTQHSRLESETFVGVTKALTEGTWTCTLQSRSDVTNPYNWQATYGEMTLAIW